MNLDIGQLVMLALTVIANGLVTLAIMKTELRYLRRDVDHAHRRLDAINAPHVWRRSVEDGAE